MGRRQAGYFRCVSTSRCEPQVRSRRCPGSSSTGWEQQQKQRKHCIMHPDLLYTCCDCTHAAVITELKEVPTAKP
jgi:hypothetical protein